MGNFRPAPTKCIEALLLKLGFKHNRTTASHDVWTKPGYRSIPIWGNEKQLPAQHIKTVSRVTGMSMQEIYKWIDENC